MNRNIVGSGVMGEKVWAVILIFVLASVPLMKYELKHVKAESNVWIVDDDRPADFRAIQDAVDAAQEGDTIKVMAGIYHEHVVVSKSISLTGENRSTTIIDGNNTGTTVLVTASNVVVEGFTVRNSESGIYVLGYSNCTVYGNVVRDNKARGILISNSQNCTVRGNYAIGTDPGYGINVNVSKNILVEENGASDNKFDGIGLFSSINSTVRKNTINGNNAFGIVVDYYSTSNTIYNNNIFNNRIQAASSNPTNSWDNGHEGNYWSNYTGIDADGDGVGDEPYTVDEETQQKDNYPLIHPYVNEIYRSIDTEPPVASFTYSYSSVRLLVNKTVSFDASDSYDSVGNNAILSYRWDFGDGNTGTGVTINHMYSSPENFTVVLTVVDAAGNEDTASAGILVWLEEATDGQAFPALAIGTLLAVVVFGLAIFMLWRRRKLPR